MSRAGFGLVLQASMCLSPASVGERRWVSSNGAGELV